MSSLPPANRPLPETPRASLHVGSAAEPQYAEVKDIRPAQASPPAKQEFDEEEERLATGRFLASFSSSMDSTFLVDVDDEDVLSVG